MMSTSTHRPQHRFVPHTLAVEREGGRLNQFFGRDYQAGAPGSEYLPARQHRAQRRTTK
jgi:hypothetical protein